MPLPSIIVDTNQINTIPFLSYSGKFAISDIVNKCEGKNWIMEKSQYLWLEWKQKNVWTPAALLWNRLY